MPTLADITASSKNAIIIASKIDSFDKACALIGLYKTLLSNKKHVDILVKGKVPSVILELFEKNSSMFLTQLKPRAFEIIIDYGTSSVEKVVYDDIVDKKKLKFLITPGSSDFSFDNVQMSEGGAKYDTTILFDIDEPNKLKELYDQNEYLFKDNSTISIGTKPYLESQIILSVGEEESYSEVVYNALKEGKIKLGKEGVEVLLNGIVNYRKVLEGGNGDSWKIITSMVSDGANLTKTINDVYFSKSLKNTDLHLALMQNVKVNNDLSMVWSLVKKDVVDKIGIGKKELDFRGRIPFNISSEYKIAIGAIETKEGEYEVVVESNDIELFDSLEFANLFGGSGTSSHSQCTIKYWKTSEFEKKLIEIISGLIRI